MFCKNCGTQLPDNATFCSKCGTKLGEGQQMGVRPQSQQKAGGKAANALRKHKVLIGLGVGVVGVILVILLLISVFYPKSKYFSYVYQSDGTAVISGNVSNEDKELITEIKIPSEVRHGRTFRVTSIGRGAFACYSHLKSIEIPDSVTSIEDYAFDSCSSLTSIEIPASVTSIATDAFEGCSSLTKIEIAGVKVKLQDINDGTWKDVVYGNENAGGYTRSDFVSDQAYQNYLLWGDTSGLKNKK